MNGRGEDGTRTGCQRGEYGGGPRASTRPIPVIAVDFDRAPGTVLLTTFSAIWDPAAERIAGGGPSYYTQYDGGWWYFPHPEGEVWFGGRRFRPIRPRGPVMVIESDPSMRVSGVQIAKVFSSRSDFEQGLKQLDTDFAAFMREVITIMGADPKLFERSQKMTADIVRDPALAKKIQQAYAILERSPLFPYYKQTLIPLFNEWNDFLKDPVSITEAITEAAFSGPFGAVGPSVASKLKRWQDRLTAARADMNVELKRLKKESLRSPESVPLSETWFEKGEQAAESAGAGLEDIGKVLKYVLIGVAAVGGVVVVSQLASSLKKGKESGSKESGPSYIERFREPRALKAPPKVLEAKATPLALPAASTG